MELVACEFTFRGKPVRALETHLRFTKFPEERRTQGQYLITRTRCQEKISLYLNVYLRGAAYKHWYALSQQGQSRSKARPSPSWFTYNEFQGLLFREVR